MIIFRTAVLRAATTLTQSFQVVPRSSRQFSTRLATTARPTPSFISFQRRLYSDEKEVEQIDEALQTDNELVAELTATESVEAETKATETEATEIQTARKHEDGKTLEVSGAGSAQTQGEAAAPSSLQRDELSPPSSTLDLPRSKKLYVGNLFFDVTGEDLQKEFSRFGPLEFARVVVDYKGFSKGFGFVTFHNEVDAEQAKLELDGTVLQGRRMLVNFTRPLFVAKEPKRPTEPTSTLFVGNLSYNLSDRDLNNLFRPLKNIRDVRIAIDRRTGQPRGFAHADFLDVKSASEAFEKLNGHEIGGRILRVDYSHSGRAAAMESYIQQKRNQGQLQ